MVKSSRWQSAVVILTAVVSLVSILHNHWSLRRLEKTTRTTRDLSDFRTSRGPPPLSLLVVNGVVEQGFALVQSNLQALNQSAQSGGIRFHCLIYVGTKEWVAAATKRHTDCLVLHRDSLWTHPLIQVGHDESNQLVATATHVAILMPDVNVTSLNLPHMLHTMQRARFDVAAPSVYGVVASGQARAHCMAHVTGHVDMLFPVFTKSAFACWQRRRDVTNVPHGWGNDVSVADACHATVGVIDHEHVIHVRRRPDNASRASDAHGAEGAAATPRLLQSSASKEYDYCHDVQFRFVSSTRRSWTARQVQWGLRHTHLSSALFQAPRGHAIDLVDSIPEWLFGSSHVSGTKWLGVLGASERSWWRGSDFEGAVRADCLVLVTFTSFTATTMAHELQGIADHVTICHVTHPMAWHWSNVSRVYHPVSDGRQAASRDAALVLWGPEHTAHRVASLHALSTRRRKVWLVAPTHDVVLVSDLPRYDDKVQTLDISQLSMTDHVQLMLCNMVLVDSTAQGSYQAAVDALFWRAPFMVRPLPGLVEYLGPDYPLYYTSLRQVQAWLDDAALWQRQSLAAHVYLVQRARHSTHTWNDVADALVNCTVRAMSQWE